MLKVIEPGQLKVDGKSIEEGSRRSGRTYRQILSCMLSASMGKTVYFQSTSTTSRDHAFRMAMQMVPVDSTIGKNGSKRRIVYPNGGVVVFVADDDLRGLDGELHQDHYWHE